MNTLDSANPESNHTTVFVSLGSNIGDRRGNLEAALEFLSKLPYMHVKRIAGLYESSPVGPTRQANFFNSVAELSVCISPGDLLVILKEYERSAGRLNGPRWGPRIIDLDILLFGKRVIREANLCIPHPEMFRRAFVLCPLSELEPDLVPPGQEQSVRELLRGCIQEIAIVKSASEWGGAAASRISISSAGIEALP